MQFISKLVTYLVPLVLFIVLQWLLYHPQDIKWVIIISLISIVAGIWVLTGRNFASEKFLRFIITPFFLLAGGILFISFIDYRTLTQLTILILVLLEGVFLNALYLRFYERIKYQTHALENISIHLNLITVFFVASGFYSLMIFLGITWWLLVLAFAGITALLNYELILTSGVRFKIGWMHIAVVTLTITEIFWAVHYLPTSMYVNGLIVVVSYYTMTGLVRNWLLEIREKKVVLRYLLIAATSLLIVLLTAKWFS